MTSAEVHGDVGGRMVGELPDYSLNVFTGSDHLYHIVLTADQIS